MNDGTIIFLISVSFLCGGIIGAVLGATAQKKIDKSLNLVRASAIQKIVAEGMDKSFEIGLKEKERYMHTEN